MPWRPGLKPQHNCEAPHENHRRDSPDKILNLGCPLHISLSAGQMVGENKYKSPVAARLLSVRWALQKTDNLVLPPCVPAILFMLPDFISGHISLIRAFHHAAKSVIVVAVKFCGIKTFGPLLYQCVIIVRLLEVEKILPVVRIR